MMLGIVDSRCEAVLPIVVGNANKQRQLIDAVIDTGFNGFLTLPPNIIATLDLPWNCSGFNGFLTLPPNIIATLDLPWNCSDVVTLGDGSETLFDLYAATVIWDGQFREIDVAESETEPLVGMALLYGYRLQIDIISGGKITIEALSNKG